MYEKKISLKFQMTKLHCHYSLAGSILEWGKYLPEMAPVVVVHGAGEMLTVGLRQF